MVCVCVQVWSGSALEKTVVVGDLKEHHGKINEDGEGRTDTHTHCHVYHILSLSLLSSLWLLCPVL